MFLNLLGAAEGVLICAAASTPPLCGFSKHDEAFEHRGRSALVGVVLAGVPILAQTQNPIVADRPAMYSAALRSGLNEMARAWGKLDLTDRGNRIPIDFGAVVVQKDSSITDGPRLTV
jgi:hypothetical protein